MKGLGRYCNSCKLAGLFDSEIYCTECNAMTSVSKVNLEAAQAMVKHVFVTRDSGERQQFPTGSVRDTREGKGRFDLIPTYPLRRLAQLYERGAVKYGDSNWQKGQPLARYMDSAFRHLSDFLDGDHVEDHLSSVLWNVIAFMWTEREIKEGRLPKELDDWSSRASEQRTNKETK